MLSFIKTVVGDRSHEGQWWSPEAQMGPLAGGLGPQWETERWIEKTYRRSLGIEFI